MKKVFLIVLLTFFCLNLGFAQKTLKNNLFKDYEQILDKLQDQNAEILSPENYKKAVEYYKEASADYDDKDNSLVNVKEKLKESRGYALKALQVVLLANKHLSKSIEAREAALAEKAPLFAQPEWDDAEDTFSDATSNLEDDDLDDAIKYGARSYDLFRRAEIQAIRNGIIGDARTQLAEAKNMEADTYCIQTYRLAQNLLNEAEGILKNDPYKKDNARKKAVQAAYEARHAQFLTKKIKSMEESSKALEYEILQIESVLNDIAVLFHYEPKFDKGIEEPAREIISLVGKLREDEKRLLKKNSQMEEKLNSLQESDAGKTARIEQDEILKGKISTIKELFKPNEAEVIYQGSKLVIHLFGLYFAPGKSIIQPEYFSLLSKIKLALKEFPDKYILIEGHTDATGNALKNKVLSQNRAKAVAEYLLADMAIDKNQIEYFGLGDQRPIASNRTREGRARNRRIDVIISIDE